MDVQVADPIATGSASSPVRWLSRRSILLHLTLAVVVPACLYAAWWQANRALSGNTLSYIYSIEWPIFAGYAVFMWWKILHESPEGRPGGAAVERPEGRPGGASAESPPDRPTEAGEAADDPELAAYNRYLAGLAASGKQKTWSSR